MLSKLEQKLIVEIFSHNISDSLGNYVFPKIDLDTANLISAFCKERGLIVRVTPASEEGQYHTRVYGSREQLLHIV